MGGNENYEHLKWSIKAFLKVITSNDLYYILFLVVLLIILLKLADLFFYPFRKRGSVVLSFMKGCIKVFLVITIGMRICSLVPVLSDFTSQILMSSSLIVVVLGFVFQEGLSNIVHGFILTTFKPFKIGDRVRITLDGQGITGYIVSMNMRQTVIQNVINSSHVIVPNAKMDTCVIENNYFDGNQHSTSFLDLTITYESDLERAIEVISRIVEHDERVSSLRKEQDITDPIPINVRELGESGVSLRAIVLTKTVEENFAACSQIRRDLVKAFSLDPSIEFAYPHVQLSQRMPEHEALL